jgi:hypothetical protein
MTQFIVVQRSIYKKDAGQISDAASPKMLGLNVRSGSNDEVIAAGLPVRLRAETGTAGSVQRELAWHL